MPWGCREWPWVDVRHSRSGSVKLRGRHSTRPAGRPPFEDWELLSRPGPFWPTISISLRERKHKHISTVPNGAAKARRRDVERRGQRATVLSRELRLHVDGRVSTAALRPGVTGRLAVHSRAELGQRGHLWETHRGPGSPLSGQGKGALGAHFLSEGHWGPIPVNTHTPIRLADKMVSIATAGQELPVFGINLKYFPPVSLESVLWNTSARRALSSAAAFEIPSSVCWSWAN